MAKKSNIVKLPKETMDELLNIRNQYSLIQMKFGELDIQKINLEDKLNTLEQNKVLTEDEYRKNIKRESDFIDSLTKKYGAGSLDLEKGVFTPSK
jgi:hypothetical protein